MGQRIAAVFSTLLACAAAAQAPLAPERVMNVRQGPETVFAAPVGTILPALAGARATGENGRVGSELVFWGYEQPNGRRVFFFACAPDVDVDCAARVPDICSSATTLVEQAEANGRLVRRQCRNIAVAAPGDRRPGCEDRLEDVPLAVGLVTCG